MKIKLNLKPIAGAIGRLVAGAVKNPAGTIATATTIALAASQVSEGVATIARAVKAAKGAR